MYRHLAKIGKKILVLCFRLRYSHTGISVGKRTLVTSSKVKDAGKNNSIRIGKDVIMKSCSFSFWGSDNTIIIEDGAKLHGVHFSVEDSSNRIEVGKKTTFFGRTHISSCEGCSLTIGEDCMFSHDIDIRTTDSHSILKDGVRINGAKDIRIGNHVWIGMQTLILKGADIPDRCVIGARSTVSSSSMEPGCMYVGSPARLIERGIEWKRERI